MPGETFTSASGPLSWRDVFEAVEASERKILAALHTIDARVDRVMAEHESRTADRRHADNGRIDGLMLAEAKRIDAMMIAEAKRIDALLTAAASAVSLASSRAEITAAALAERVDTSAKALAAQVELTAKAAAVAVEATAKALGERIAPLEQSRYEQAGRRGLSGPMLLLIAGLVGGVAVFVVETIMKSGLT